MQTQKSTSTDQPALYVRTTVAISACGHDGYTITIRGIPEEPSTSFECLGEHPRVELFGKILAAARDIPAIATVRCVVLGELVRWHQWPHSDGPSFTQFIESLDNALDADPRLDCRAPS